MLPEGWMRIRLGEVFSFKNGLNGEKSLYGSGTKFINVMDVFRGPRLRSQDIIGEMKVSPRQLTEFAVKHGDVLFNRTSETDDEIALSTVYLGTEPVVFGGFVIRAHPIGKAIIPEFSVYRFQAADIRREMIRRGQGAIRSNIGQGDLSTIFLTLPPLPEQRKIAEILSTWDRAIEVTQKLIANARAQKKALMQQLLTGKKRLPGFKGKWSKIQLARAFSERSERGHASSSLLSVTQTEGIIPQEDAGRRNISSFDQSHYKAVHPGDIAYNTMRMWQGASALSSLSGIVSPAYTVLKANDKHSASYYSYLFKLPKMIHTFERHSQGLVSDTWNLKYPHFAKINVHVPNEEEQQAIAECLLAHDALIAKLVCDVRHQRDEKISLMQQLLTGKRRVKIEEMAK